LTGPLFDASVGSERSVSPGAFDAGDAMTENESGMAGAREDLCRFLSACYYEPTDDFREEGLFDSMLAAAENIGPDLAESARRLGAAFAGQDVQTLLIDYTRLFLGPVQALAMPYGSRWLTGDAKLMQDSTMAVLEIYEEGGFDVGEDFQDLPDHVAVEMEFLYLLIYTQNDARGGGDSEAVLAAQLLERRFLREHLGTWVGAFTGAVKAGAETAFYRELAELTQRFVKMEAALLSRH
jgi:putative dimethyl sulfoxide reductase chaperone